MDSLIAAIAAAHGLVVVTRNVRDMERCGVRVCNPWESNPKKTFLTRCRDERDEIQKSKKTSFRFQDSHRVVAPSREYQEVQVL